MLSTEKSHPKARASVAVIGAGVSGLAAAYRLKKEGLDVTVFEAGEAEGGKIRSFQADGFLWEKGPNTMVEAGEPVVGDLIDELNIRDQQILPRDHMKRYIVRNGKPELAPASPLDLFGNKLLSTKAKLRLLAEPFAWKRRSEAPDGKPAEEESVGAFMERHIGKEPVDYLLDPFCAGTTGSDPQSLAVRYAFPGLWELEQSKGSLFVGAISAAFAKKDKQGPGDVAPKQRKRPRGSFSFLAGMQTLPSAFADRIGRENLQLSSPVTALEWSQQGNPNRSLWKVTFNPGRDPNAKTQQKNFDAVICTAPLFELQTGLRVAREGKDYPLDFIPKVVYQPFSVMLNAFRLEDVKRPLQGFGVLIPSKEGAAHGLKSLGTIFSSAMFENRAPDGTVLFTTFIGGSRNPSLAARPLEEVQKAALEDLRSLVGAQGSPIMTKHVYWPRAFPQYGKSYGDVLQAISKLEKDLPAFYYAGNHRGGLSVGKSIVSGYQAAGQLISHMEVTGGDKLFTMATALPPPSPQQH